MIKIVVIRVIDRIKEAGNLQRALTRNAKLIRARLGFHELNDSTCSREGFIVLVLNESEANYGGLMSDLNSIYGIELRELTLVDSQSLEAIIPRGNNMVSVVSLFVWNREEAISEIQDIFSRYGCSIRTRLGINENIDGVETGIIILELCGNTDEQQGLVNRLLSLGEARVSALSFS